MKTLQFQLSSSIFFLIQSIFAIASSPQNTEAASVILNISCLVFESQLETFGCYRDIFDKVFLGGSFVIWEGSCCEDQIIDIWQIFMARSIKGSIEIKTISAFLIYIKKQSIRYVIIPINHKQMSLSSLQITLLLTLFFLFLSQATSFQILPFPSKKSSLPSNPDRSSCTATQEAFILHTIEQASIIFGDSGAQNAQYIYKTLAKEFKYYVNVIVLSNISSQKQYFAEWWLNQYCRFVSTGKNRFNPKFGYLIILDQSTSYPIHLVSFAYEDKSGEGINSTQLQYAKQKILNINQQIPNIYDQQVSFIVDEFRSTLKEKWLVIIANKNINVNSVIRSNKRDRWFFMIAPDNGNQYLAVSESSV